jgi:hypothetical protein
VRIRLTRKLCEILNGLDLRPFTVGQMIELEDPSARMLIAEGWAELGPLNDRSTADERSPRRNRPSTRQRLNKLLSEAPGRPRKTRT